ncbi:HNH endonuclease [Natrinema versiforme]|uniref:HNH endonuclease n=1 Tax=Natrinema versiforme TaxID=88724 RepID=UPI001E55A668|nr:HNH endonuclease signature motif containing protein [Natrinema versiforme]
MTVGTYETTVEARAIDPEFRATALARFDRTCPISGVDHPGLLDIAHVLPWSDYPEYRADLSNVLSLSKTYHAAFDQGLFTIDQDYRVRVNPAFETESELLRRTILDCAIVESGSLCSGTRRRLACLVVSRRSDERCE